MNIELIKQRHEQWYELMYPLDYLNYRNDENYESARMFERSRESWVTSFGLFEKDYIEVNTRSMDGLQAIIAVQQGKAVEYTDGVNGWEDLNFDSRFKLGIIFGELNQDGRAIKFRLKLEYMAVNGVQLVAPLREQPRLKTNYWFYNPKKPNGIATGCWEGDIEDVSIFENIGIYLEEVHVAQYRDVMRNLIRGVVEHD